MYYNVLKPVEKKLIGAVLCAVLVFFIFGCSNRKETNANVTINRIVSCAPSITETLFALELGEKVIGVTSYCSFPPQVSSIEKVGGYTDINLEKVISLKPDVVILQQEHERQRTFFNNNKIKVITVNYKNITGICSSFVLIGRACGAIAQADSLVLRFKSKLKPDLVHSISPKVLLCVGRNSPGTGSIQGVFAAGAATFYNEIIVASGGVNAFPDSLPNYPQLSQEGIISLAPDIVIDIGSAMNNGNCKSLTRDWQSITMVPAVKNKRVYCLDSDYSTVPGPRILLLIDEFRRIINQTSTELVKE
jgi:iron complex transport system substrate-binding protein